MKRILLLQLFLFTTFGFAQVGVNTATPDPSSVLDVTSTNKGALFPRVNLASINTTSLDGTNTAAIGLLIWNTNPSTTGGNGVGYYFFNGTFWVPVKQTSSSDHDWYDVGTTTPPSAINNNKYTEGSITIGSNTIPTGVVDIDNATKSTSLDINNTFSGNPTGINLSITSNNSGKTGTMTTFNGTSPIGDNNFTYNLDNTIGNSNRNGILQEFNGTSSSISTTIRGLRNSFLSTSNYYAVIQGVENNFESNTNAFRIGISNNFSNGGTSQITGVQNNFSGSSTGIAYGITNMSSNYNGQLYGMYNTFSGTGNGDHYGIQNSLSGSGTGNKYGIYNFILNTSGGVHYGIYSNVLKTGSFAGYFLGNVSIGTTPANNYILPPSRGTNGQIMQTDGVGSVSWINPSTIDTDNQQIDILSLTGDTLNISLQDDGVATQTLNLAAIDNQQIDVLSLTGDVLNISLQDDGVPTQTLNLSAIDNQATDVFSLTGTTLNLSLQNDGVATQTVDLSALPIDNQQIDVLSLTGDVLNISLQDDGVATQTLNLSAIDNQATDVFSLIGTTLNLSLQNDGVATQTVNLASLDTDNQQIDVLTLTGDTLNISLQDDGVATQTLNLAAIDNQTTDVFSLTGTTLNLSLQNDGVATQTVDLAPLRDHDWYEIGGTTPPNSITDNKYTQGSITIGTNTAATGVLDIDNSTKSTSLDITNTYTVNPTGINIDINSTSSNKVGVNVLHSGTTAGFGGVSSMLRTIDSSIGDFNRVGLYQAFTGESTNTSVDYTGVRNAFAADNFVGDMIGISNADFSTSNGNRYGAVNSFYGTGSGVNYGVYNFFNGTGTGVKYGVYNQIETTAGGTHYGIYSNVLKAGSYAGYFLGNVSVGTTIGNNYILPTSRGTNGQIMQTNGTGIASWVNPATVFTDTDDQNIQNLAFNTTTNILTVGIENGTSQTVDLSSLNTGGDITAVTAGAGLTGGGITGVLTLTAAANNGLNVDAGADAIQLGGPLVENTSITQGIYSMDINLDSTGDFSIQDNGTDILFVEDSGEIGIGTNTPAYPLHMIENGAVDNAFFLDKTETSANNTSGIFINKTGQGTGRSHAIFTDVDGTGTGQKYGVFNQISSAAAGSQYGTRNFISGNSPSNQFGTFNNLDNAGTGTHYGSYNGMRGTSAATLYANYNEFDNATTATNSYGNYTSFSANSTGTGDKYGTYNIITATLPGTHYGTYNSVSAASGWAGYFLGRNYISDREAIGETDNPNAGLSINKNSTGTYSHIELKEAGANDGARLTFSNTAEVTNNWLLYGRADNTITDSRFNIFHTTTGNIMQITGDGLVGILRAPTTNQLEINGTASKTTAGAFIANSDSRLKKNIVTISPTEALDKVLRLRGVTYEWNDNKTGMNRPEGTQLGFVAQEIQQVFPDKVAEDKQGYLQTAYGDYDPIIFQAIKALSDKIDKLEKENEALKKRIEEKK